MRLIGEPANAPRKAASSRRASSASGGARRSSRATSFASVALARELVPRADREAVVAAVDAIADRAAGTRARCGPDARSSGRRCSAAHRAGRAPGRRRSGRRRGRRGSEPQWSRSGGSGASARSVRISPRNSQEPSSRETRLVCLPCQPSPACWASGFSSTGAVSTKTLTSAAGLGGEPARELLEPALDQLVVVAMAGVDRDRAALAPRRAPPADPRRARSSARARSRFAPPATGCRGLCAALGIAREPGHLAMPAGGEEGVPGALDRARQLGARRSPRRRSPAPCARARIAAFSRLVGRPWRAAALQVGRHGAKVAMPTGQKTSRASDQLELVELGRLRSKVAVRSQPARPFESPSRQSAKSARLVRNR